MTPRALLSLRRRRGEMSLSSEALIFDRYGAKLNTDKIAEVMSITKAALYNQLSAGTCPVPTYLEGGKRFADYRDVALYLDQCRALAARGLPA